MEDKELYNAVAENALIQVYINWDDAIKNIYEKYVEFINNKKQKNVKKQNS